WPRFYSKNCTCSLTLPASAHRYNGELWRYQTSIDSASSTKPRVSVCFIDQSTTLWAKRVLFPSGKIHFERYGFDVPEGAP
ncbi:TPA: hypothetical protein ACF3X9_003692, partial [Escherichia coli]